MSVRPGDYCKKCGTISDRDDPFTHLTGYRGWCISCEDEDAMAEAAAERAKQKSREDFMALPDDEKWDRIYDAVFEKGGLR